MQILLKTIPKLQTTLKSNLIFFRCVLVVNSGYIITSDKTDKAIYLETKQGSEREKYSVELKDNCCTISDVNLLPYRCSTRRSSSWACCCFRS
jgi:hypothetical protein